MGVGGGDARQALRAQERTSGVGLNPRERLAGLGIQRPTCTKRGAQGRNNGGRRDGRRLLEIAQGHKVVNFIMCNYLVLPFVLACVTDEFCRKCLNRQKVKLGSFGLSLACEGLVDTPL